MKRQQITIMETISSRYFSLEELTRSKTALQRHLDNTPDQTTIEHLKALVSQILDPMRVFWGSPLYVNSGYRSRAVNAAVGGARNSQHVTGDAVDITAGSPQKNRKLLGLVLQHAEELGFDQIIAEKCDSKGNPRWLHISRSNQPRNQLIFIKS